MIKFLKKRYLHTMIRMLEELEDAELALSSCNSSDSLSPLPSPRHHLDGAIATDIVIDQGRFSMEQK